MKKKHLSSKWKFLLCLGGVMTISAGLLVSCKGRKISPKLETDWDVFQRVCNQSRLFKNDFDHRIKQINDYYPMIRWLAQEANNRVLFLGYDGTRADALVQQIQDHPDTSGVKDLANWQVGQYTKNGLYLGISENQRARSGSGWTSLLTGKWDYESGVMDNSNNNFLLGVHTLMYQQCMGVGDDGGHSFLTRHDVTFNGWRVGAFDTDFDSMDDPGKDKLLENEKMNDGEDDAAADARYYANTKETLTEIKNGSGDKHDTRFVCTIFDQVDHMGHSYGFSKNVPQYMNALKVVDEYSQDLINIVKSDTTHHWLVVMTTDHAGHQYDHGTNPNDNGGGLLDHTTWFASNRFDANGWEIPG